ncbi:helix-turn-helix domain-containing protein, partial [Melissococcus plutonius]
MGDRIKRLRIEANLTQEELGKKVGLKRAAINKYEKGNVENMKRSVVEKMSFIFNVSPSYLMALDNNLTENIPNITTIYSELNQLRQNKVYNYAEQQLTEQKQEQQSNVVPFNSSNDDQLTSFDWCGYVSAGTGEFLDGNERKSII